MEVENVGIEGLLLIKPKVFGDERGFFVETWHQERYAKMGLVLPFVQDNHSTSRYGVLRGLHFQTENAQGKLVSVSYGSVFDVAVDIRKGSKTFGKWYGVHLSAENQWQLWLEPGFAHGFVVTSEIAHFHYKCTSYYDPKHEGAIRYDDPDIAIEWPVKNFIVSDKDKNSKTLKELFMN